MSAEAPTKYELVVNLKTAKELALQFRQRCSPVLTQSSNSHHKLGHVRYWHLADIPSCTAHVRYWG